MLKEGFHCELVSGRRSPFEWRASIINDIDLRSCAEQPKHCVHIQLHYGLRQVIHAESPWYAKNNAPTVALLIIRRRRHF